MKKVTQNGFTLAEVLLALGIIGVVAALSMPTIMGNYQKKTYLTSLHKVYNELSQAVEQAMTDKNAGTIDEAGLTSQTALNNWVKTYFKVTHNCEGNSSKCLAPSNQYRKLKNTESFITSRSTHNYYALSNGAVIRPLIAKEGAKRFNILVDTNGKKAPNTLGRDVFFIGVYNNGGIDDYAEGRNAPLSNSDRNTLFTDQCNANNGSAWGCFGKILADGWQMNY